MKSKTIVLGVLSVFILSVSLLAQVTPAQRAEIEKTLTAASKEWVASINQLNVDAWTKYLSEDFQEYVGSGNVNASGKAAFIKLVTGWFAARASQKIEIDSIKVYVISPDSAYVLMIGGGSVLFKGGRHGGFGLAESAIWKKEPGGWKVIHWHESGW